MSKSKIVLITCIIALFAAIISFISCTNAHADASNNLDEKEYNVAPPKRPYYEVTADERDLLARIVTCEASVCSIECQKAVCSVIFNRLESGCWRKDMNQDGNITLYDIIYYPNAFTPASNGKLADCKEASTEAYEAVDYVITYGPTLPQQVRYFRANYDFKWMDYENFAVIDNVYFGYFTTWKSGVW